MEMKKMELETEIKQMEAKEDDILILGIESSCDETAASVVRNGRTVLSNVISSQIDLHTLYGGVVPEIASRKHIERINQVVTQALTDADVTLDDMTAIAVTYGPGLVGALLVGVAEAKAIAFAADKPLVGVHHIEGHISANFIEHQELEPPFACLVVSGGHTHLVVVKITENMRSSVKPVMMRQERHLTRWQERSDSAIRAVLRSIRWQKKVTRRQFIFRVPKWAKMHMISVSAA